MRWTHAAAVVLTWGIPILSSAHAATSSESWTPETFDYERPDRLQFDDETERMKTRMTGLNQKRYVFTNLRGERVAVLLTLPRGEPPFPVVLLAHGFEHDKDGVARQLARPLADVGLASLAIDLPFHGERPGPPEKMFPKKHPEESYRNVVNAVMDLRQAIDLAEQLRDLHTSRGVLAAGYSMGAWLVTLAAGADRRINGMVLMVAGSAAITAETREAEGPGLAERLDLVHRYPVLRHNAAIARFGPRPLLMLNGRKDVLVPQERAKALYAAAREPKESRWYDAGHLLPAPAYREAAEWLASKVRK